MVTCKFVPLLFLSLLTPLLTGACTCYTDTTTTTPTTCPPPPKKCATIPCVVVEQKTVPPKNAHCPQTATITRTAACPDKTACPGCGTAFHTVTGCYTATSTLFPPCPAPLTTVTKKDGSTKLEPCPTPKCIVKEKVTVTVPPRNECGCPSTKTETSTFKCPRKCHTGCATEIVTKTITET